MKAKYTSSSDVSDNLTLLVDGQLSTFSTKYISMRTPRA